MQVQEKKGLSQAIGKSAGGLSTKIHALCDAPGNPTYLTSGKAHDLSGADVLLPELKAKMLIADKAYDADKRVLDKLKQMNIEPVIPSKSNRKHQREHDLHLYKARHLIENFFQKLKLYRAIGTRYDKTARNFLAAVYLAASVILLH